MQASITMFEKEFYNFSINRSYYAVFDAIRAINALDNFDSSKHSGVISYFNQNYVKTEIFNSNTSKIIKKASLLREKSDYEDFYCATKQEAKECINQEELTTVEIKILKKVLNKYREYIKIYEDIGEGIESAVNLIRTEQDLLDILDNQSNHTLKVNLPYQGKTYNMTFVIEPLNDSRAVSNLQLQLDLFADFNEREKLIYSKGSNGQGLSREEKLVYDKLVKQVTENAQSSQDIMVNKLLSSQLHIDGSTATIEERQRFWEKFPFTPKMMIFMKVQDKLGLSEISQEELFPTC